MAPGTPESLQAALTSAKSKSPIERESALRIMANRNDRLADLQRALYDSSRLVRNQAADTLSTQFNPTQSAFQEWQQYAEANADRPAGALRRAELAVLQGDAALAKQLAQQAADFDKNNAHLLYDVAIMFARVGDIDGALLKIDQAKRIDTSLGLIWFGEGLLYAEKGDTSRSIQSMERAVQLDPVQDRWWYNLGVAHMQVGQTERAKEALSKAVELNPSQAQYKQVLDGL
jgi:tetratricopeptide (TPR) repeat protein